MTTRKTNTKSKAVPIKDLGNPKSVTIASSPLLLGTVRGRAEKVISRTMPTGDAYEGLSGFFECEPHDATADIVRSDTCYLPAEIFKQIANPLRDAQKTNEKAMFDFVISVGAVFSTNEAGYEWQFTPVMAHVVTDPIAHLRGANPGKQTAKK